MGASRRAWRKVEHAQMKAAAKEVRRRVRANRAEARQIEASATGFAEQFTVEAHDVSE